jgi:hypothetical protein
MPLPPFAPSGLGRPQANFQDAAALYRDARDALLRVAADDKAPSEYTLQVVGWFREAHADMTVAAEAAGYIATGDGWFNFDPHARAADRAPTRPA